MSYRARWAAMVVTAAVCGAALLYYLYAHEQMVPERRLPQCIIIGVMKGGTHALEYFMDLHPSVQTAKKEIRFFSIDEFYERGYDWYRFHMPYSYADQITIEKTALYYIHEFAASRVYAMNNSIKVILVVRDPIRRAISDYTHRFMFSKGALLKPVQRFDTLAINRTTGRVNESYAAIERSVYHRHMERWLRYFPLSQIHIVSGERLITDPVAEIAAVERFLGLAPYFTDNMFYFNRSRGFYCLSRTHKCLKSKGRIHPHVQPRVIGALEKFFKPHNERFFKQIGGRLPWLGTNEPAL